jgi:hypothetical protein
MSRAEQQKRSESLYHEGQKLTSGEASIEREAMPGVTTVAGLMNGQITTGFSLQAEIAIGANPEEAVKYYGLSVD